MIEPPAPIHRSRAARLIRATVDGDADRATAVYVEAINDSALIDLTAAVGFITLGTLHIATKGNADYMRGYLDDLILKARIGDQA